MFGVPHYNLSDLVEPSTTPNHTPPHPKQGAKKFQISISNKPYLVLIWGWGRVGLGVVLGSELTGQGL